MPLAIPRSLPVRQADASATLANGEFWSAAIFNFAELSPRNQALLPPSGGSWTNAGSYSWRGIEDTFYLFSDGATSSGSSFGSSSQWNEICGANTPFFAAFEFVYNGYVNNGSSTNVVWSKGNPAAVTGVYAAVNSVNLSVRCAHTLLTYSATLVIGKRYRCCFGRSASGACGLWVDGQLVASGSGATASHTGNTLYALRDDTTLRTFQGGLSLLAFGGQDPFEFGARLSADPWSIYAPARRVLIFPDAAGGHVLTGANCSQPNAADSGAIGQTHVLAGADVTQTATSASGSVEQTHILTGAGPTQDATSPGGAIILGGEHVLTGANVSQENTTTTGAIGQTHLLAGASVTQGNSSTSGAIGQSHILLGSGSAQDAFSPGGAIVIGDVHVLSGENAIQLAYSPGGSIVQTHVLTGANCSQDASSPGGGAWQTHLITGAAATQTNSSSSGALSGAADVPILAVRLRSPIVRRAVLRSYIDAGR